MVRFSTMVTTVPQLPGVRGNVVWLEPVIVCEVGYMEVTKDRKLRIPRFLRLRMDKKPTVCTTDQPTDTPPYPPITAGDEEGQKNRPELRKYHEKRNFSVTNEPEGLPGMSGSSFVIQEHHARHLHFDLRLERDGVLKSWAVPKGVPEIPGEKHLAVAVEDHPLEYAKFEGEIAKGEYGAGTVTIWDSGTYTTKHWDDQKIEVMLHGQRVNGLYVLVKFKRAGKNEWLLFRTGE
jgi:DNA ligase D-like protein (predicted 3'-phosphoesterase)